MFYSDYFYFQVAANQLIVNSLLVNRNPQNKTKMNNKRPTSRQLERELSQQIKNFYQEQISLKPQKITCKLFSRYIAIVADNALTPVESNLWQLGNQILIQKVRNEINQTLKPKLSKLISDILNVEVEALLEGADFGTNRFALLVVLSQPPLLR